MLNAGAIKDKSKINALIASCYNNAERLIRIVDDILDITKLESEGFRLDKKKNNLEKTIKKTKEGIQSYLDQCKVSLTINMEEGIKDFVYDELRVIQILNNLLSNAAKFSPDNSSIILDIETDKNFIIFKVSDQGDGIPKDKLLRIF